MWRIMLVVALFGVALALVGVVVVPRHLARQQHRRLIEPGLTDDALPARVVRVGAGEAFEGERVSLGYASVAPAPAFGHLTDAGGSIVRLSDGADVVRYTFFAPSGVAGDQPDPKAMAEILMSVPPPTNRALEQVMSQDLRQAVSRHPDLHLRLLAAATGPVSWEEYRDWSNAERERYALLALSKRLTATNVEEAHLLDAPEIVALIGQAKGGVMAEVWGKRCDRSQMIFQTTNAVNPASVDEMIRLLSSLRYEDVEWNSAEELEGIIAGAIETAEESSLSGLEGPPGAP